jgi:APA family basic amino acid/polyamine antiporter
MLIMRRRAPDAPRTFRTPAAWFVGGFGVLGCFYLFLSLPSKTQIYFLIWNAIGLVVYAATAARRRV